jgi:glucose/arabinose dehydrogenase
VPRRYSLTLTTLALLVALVGTALARQSTGAAFSPSRFQLTPVISGLEQPTAVTFTSDGRVFVAEKDGRVLGYRSLSDTKPRLVVDLRKRVDAYWDRGLLAIEADPDFARHPYLYLLYSLDAPPGQAPPVWHDTCPDPPGGMKDGCVDTGVLSRVRVTGLSAGKEQVLIKDRWCHQFTSHDVGDLAFGPGRALYVSAGEGSNWAGVDYGQYGGSAGSPTPRNPCGDPPPGTGATLTPPTAQGGALRAQDLMSELDPVSYDGTVIRVSPDTGRALPSNPLYGGKHSEDDAIVAFGLRNPYRLAVRPGGDLYIADAGWDRFEEINRLPAGKLLNFGWPCYEGPRRQPVYAAAGLSICQQLYSGQRGYTSAPLRLPYFSYPHSNPPGATCDGKGSVPSGVAFYEGSSYPAALKGALFFSDYSARCLFVMPAGANGRPNPRAVELVKSNVPLVDLARGPGGDLFAVDIEHGAVLRLRYFKHDRPPLARATASPQSGKTPLTVTLSASASSDADGGRLRYAWDFEGDGHFDAAGVTVHHVYKRAGLYRALVRVSDRQGMTSTAVVTVRAGNTPPAVTIDTPPSGYHYKANEYLIYSGHAQDAEDGKLTAGSLSWTFVLHHCASPGHCHVHVLETRPGTDTGGINVPDHEMPSYLELRLTATDSQGATTTVSRSLTPQTATLVVKSDPAGATLAVGAKSGRAPFSYTAYVDGSFPVSAPRKETIAGKSYVFAGWSDGGAPTHTVKASDSELIASYKPG